MIKYILVPLDGSKTAEAALPYAGFLAGLLKIPLELLHVLDAPQAGMRRTEAGENFDTALAETERRSKSYLEEMKRRIPGSIVNCGIAKGRPAEAIIEKAASRDGTLIVMATHGRSGIQRWLLGSIAEKVLRATHDPLLLVRARDESRAEDKPPIESITVALDGSDLAESVLPLVTTIARSANLALLLLRVYELPASAYYGSEDYLPNYEELKGELKKEVETYLGKKIDALRSQGVDQVSALATEGAGPDEIVSYARERPNTLLVLCTHGRSGLKRWVLGSVTEKVVRHSRGPVLVLRAA